MVQLLEPPTISTRDDTNRKEETGHYEAYAAFSRTLRAWFVAYGIGAPVLIVSQARLYDALLQSERFLVVAGCFLAGVGLQLVTTIVYKSAMWYLYRGEYIPSVKKSWVYGPSNWLSEAMWLELLIDAATALLFGIATVTLLQVALIYRY